MRAGIVALVSTGCMVGGGQSGWTFDDADVLVVRVGSGDIEVRSSPDGITRVFWEGGGVGDNASPDVFDDGNTVVVDANGGVLGGGSVRAEVPAGVALDLTVHRGAVLAAIDAPADISSCVATGDVELYVPPGGYFLDLGVGIGAISTEIWHDPSAEYRLEACAGIGAVTVSVYEGD